MIQFTGKKNWKISATFFPNSEKDLLNSVRGKPDDIKNSDGSCIQIGFHYYRMNINYLKML